MYFFKAFQTDVPWITSVREIKDLAATAEKAIDIVCEEFKYYPCRVDSVSISGGIHERDTGFESFASRKYPYRDGEKSWSGLLAEDFSKEEDELIRSTGGYFSTLNFSSVMITLLLTGEPVVLHLTRWGNLEVMLPWEKGEHKDRILAALEREFGPAGQR